MLKNGFLSFETSFCDHWIFDVLKTSLLSLSWKFVVQSGLSHLPTRALPVIAQSADDNRESHLKYEVLAPPSLISSRPVKVRGQTRKEEDHLLHSARKKRLGLP